MALVETVEMLAKQTRSARLFVAMSLAGILSVSCASGASGTFEQTGEDAKQQEAPTPDRCGVVDLSMGKGKDCVLREDGAVVCWNPDNVGLQVFGGLVSPRQIAAASGFVCALDGPRGHVSCWGELQVAKILPEARTVVPVALQPHMDMGPFEEGVVDLQSVQGAFCALKIDGGVWCWGGRWPVPTQLATQAQQLSIGGGGSSETQVWIRTSSADNAPWTNATTRDPRDEFVGAELAVNGLVAVLETPRQLRIHGSPVFSDSIVFPTDVHSVSVPVSNHFMCAHGDRLYCWGSMDQAPNAPIQVISPEPQHIRGVSNVTKIATGFDNVCVLTASRVFCFGRAIPGSRRLADGDFESVGLTQFDPCGG